MNEYAKGLLREKGINPERNMRPQAREGIENRKIPTERLIARLDLTPYVTHELPEERKLSVKRMQDSSFPAYRQAGAGSRTCRGAGRKECSGSPGGRRTFREYSYRNGRYCKRSDRYIYQNLWRGGIKHGQSNRYGGTVQHCKRN